MADELQPTRRFSNRTESFVERSEKSGKISKGVESDKLPAIKVWVEEMNASDPRPHPRKHPCFGCAYLYPQWMAGRDNATAVTTCTRYPPTTNGTHEAHYPDVTRLLKACGEYGTR